MEKNLRYTGPDGSSILDAVNKMERLYQVPLSYFEGLADEIMAKIRLGAFSANTGYQVPEGYFSGLADKIMSRIHAEGRTTSGRQNEFSDPAVSGELEQVAPLLLQIGNQNVYKVPEGYFESLSPSEAVGPYSAAHENRIIEEKTGGKVIALTPRKRIWRTAVAAAAIVVVLFSGERYFTNHHDSNIPRATGTQFASKIQTNNDSFRSGVSQLSDEEIMGYLSTPDPALRDSMNEKATEETQKAISSMTNEELESYLERTPATY